MSENIDDLEVFTQVYFPFPEGTIKFESFSASACCLSFIKTLIEPFREYGLRNHDFINDLDTGIYLFFRNIKKLF